MTPSASKNNIRQAVLLAGGQGTRLRPLTLSTPKPLIMVGGKPFVQYMVEHLIEQGVSEIIFLTGYLAEQFPATFGDGSAFGINIRYCASPPEDESGTRVKSAYDLLDERFLLLYADNFWPVPVRELAAVHQKKNKLVTMAAFSNKDGSAEYGAKNNLTVTDGLISHYGDASEDLAFNATDVGTFAVEKDALHFLPKGNSVFQRDLIRVLIQKGEVAAFITDTQYCYITSEALLAKAKLYLSRAGLC